MSNVTVTKMEYDTPIKEVKLYLYFEALCKSEKENDTFNLDFNEEDFDKDALKEKIIELIQDKLTRDLSYNKIEFDIYFDEEDQDLRLLGNLKFNLLDTTYGVLEELEGCLKEITDEDFANAINSVKKNSTEEIYVNSEVESDFKVDHAKIKETTAEVEDSKISTEEVKKAILNLKEGETFDFEFEAEDLAKIGQELFENKKKEDESDLEKAVYEAIEDKVSEASFKVADIPSKLTIKKIDDTNSPNSFVIIQTWNEATIYYTFDKNEGAEYYEFSSIELGTDLTYEQKYNASELFEDNFEETALADLLNPMSDLWKA